jgi:hypothetical protein
VTLAIEIDGGVKPDNARTYADGGADMLTVGTGIYQAADPVRAVRTLIASTAGPPRMAPTRKPGVGGSTSPMDFPTRTSYRP